MTYLINVTFISRRKLGMQLASLAAPLVVAVLFVIPGNDDYVLSCGGIAVAAAYLSLTATVAGPNRWPYVIGGST